MKLTELLDRFGTVTATHDGWLAHCPAHTDAQASLRIAVTPTGTALLTCRASCDTANVLGVVGLSFSDLYNVTDLHAAPTISATRKEELPIAVIAALRGQLDGYVANDLPLVKDYALNRFGIDAASFVRLGLGAADDLAGGQRLVVPFANPVGMALGFQARALDNDARVRWTGPSNPESGSWSRIGFFSGDSSWDPVVITEGPGDALTVCATGYDAIAVRGAGLASVELAEQIVSWVPNRTIILAGDGDRAGRSFSSSLAEYLADLGVTVKILDLPDGQDLTDWRESNPAVFAGELQVAVGEAPIASSTAGALMQRDETLFPLSDLGNARFVAALATQQGTSLRYVDELGFLILDRGVWVQDRLDRSRSLVHEAADLVAQIAELLRQSAGSDRHLEAEAKKWNSWAKYCASRNGISSVLSEIIALPSVATRVEDLDRRHDLLAVKNGVINLRTGELMPHDPLLLLTKRIDLDYSPDAPADRWVQFLGEVMQDDQSMVDYIQRLVGYSITGETSEQCFSVLWGTGSNGKSMFTGTLSSVFNQISETTSFSTFEQKASGGIPNDLAALRAARLVFASEGESDAPMAESLLKRVTGSDPISARFLRREFFTFRPMFQLFLASNSKPSFKGADEGLWRRVKLIPFLRYFAPDERDQNLGRTLLAESAGILAWAVRGSVQWFDSGLEDPAPIIAATSEYRATSDPLSGFLPGVFTLDHSAKRVLGKDIFDSYMEWCAAENLKNSEIPTRRKFFGWLEERGLTKRTANSGVAFDGIRRTRPSDFPDDGLSISRLEAVRPLTTSVSVMDSA